MNSFYQHLQLGQLAEAINVIKSQLVEHPMNFNLRGQYIELLCINQELEKAKKELDFLAISQPEVAASIINFRQLIDAEQARQRFYKGLELPELLHEPNNEDEHFLSLHKKIAKKEHHDLDDNLHKLKKAVNKLNILINDQDKEVYRDLDDSLCRYVEVLSSNGKFNIVNLINIERLEFLPTESLIDNHWLPVNLEIKNGPGGTVYIPSTYIDSESDKEKLGQITEWSTIGKDCVIGRGLKMMLIGQNAVPINQLDIALAA